MSNRKRKYANRSKRQTLTNMKCISLIRQYLKNLSLEDFNEVVYLLKYHSDDNPMYREEARLICFKIEKNPEKYLTYENEYIREIARGILMSDGPST